MGVEVCECRPAAKRFWKDAFSDEYGGENTDNERVWRYVCGRYHAGGGTSGYGLRNTGLKMGPCGEKFLYNTLYAVLDGATAAHFTGSHSHFGPSWCGSEIELIG